MTLSTSLVAVWYSSDSSRSRVRACNFTEQPRILDRDDCLVGKGSHQFDLPLGIWLHSFPRESNHTEHGPLAHERHPKSGTLPGRHNLGNRIVRVGADVRDMHNPTFERHTPDGAVATGDSCSLAHVRPILGLCRNPRLGARHSAVNLAIAHPDSCEIGAAKPGGRFDHCVQHRLHIGGRAADDVEHVARRGLVFERFFEVARAGLQFAEQPRILHRDHHLVGKGADQLYLAFGVWLHSIPRESDHADHDPLA